VLPPKYDESETMPLYGIPRKQGGWVQISQMYFAVGLSVGLTVFLIILWPIPMHLFTGVFGQGGFTCWVVIVFLWLMIAGTIIILMPARELFMSLTGEGKILLERDTLRLKIDRFPAQTQALKDMEEVQSAAETKCAEAIKSAKDKTKVLETKITKMKEDAAASKAAEVAATEKKAAAEATAEKLKKSVELEKKASKAARAKVAELEKKIELGSLAPAAPNDYVGATI